MNFKGKTKQHRRLVTLADPAGRVCLAVAFALSIMSGVAGLAGAAPLAATSPGLGAAGSYSVLAGQTVTNAGSSTISGDLGVSPGSAVTGFPPGIVGPPGTIHTADGSASSAQSANAGTFGALDQGCTTTYAGVKDLGSLNLGPGVYCADAFVLSGNLTLSGSGVWIFKSAAMLTTSPNSSVSGGDPCNVWWRLASSGTVGTGSQLIGNILALTSITMQTGASLDGRVLAQTGSVTLDSNRISGPSCAAAPTPAPGAPTPTAIPPQPSHVDVSYPCSTDGTQVVVTVGLSAGVIVYGLGADITSATDTATHKIVRTLPFGHYDWHATPPAGHYMLDVASGVINPVVCSSFGPGATATATGVPALLAVTGADLTGDHTLAARRLMQGSLGFLGLGMMLLGVALWRKRR